MAAEWVPCGSGFIEADVIRWTEGVWRRPRPRRGKAVNIGDVLVVAEVLRDSDGWLDLLVRGCTIVSEKPVRKILPLPADEPLRRERHTVEKGNPQQRRAPADEGLCSSGDFITFGDFDSQLKVFIVLDGTRRLRRHASRGIRCHAGLAT